MSENLRWILFWLTLYIQYERNSCREYAVCPYRRRRRRCWVAPMIAIKTAINSRHPTTPAPPIIAEDSYVVGGSATAFCAISTTIGLILNMCQTKTFSKIFWGVICLILYVSTSNMFTNNFALNICKDVADRKWTKSLRQKWFSGRRPPVAYTACPAKMFYTWKCFKTFFYKERVFTARR